MKKCLNCEKPVKNKFCNTTCQNLYQNKEKNDKIYGEFAKFEVNCNICHNKFNVVERKKLFPKKEKYFCSISCSQTRIHSEESKLKISESLKKRFKKEIKVCKNCSNKFISKCKKTFLCSRNCSIEYRKNKYDLSYFGKLGGIKSRQNNLIIKQNHIKNRNIKTFIYILSDENGLVRYVGKSSKPNNRLKRHIIESKNYKTHKEKWLTSMLKKGLTPTIEIIDEVLFSEWQFWEVFYIQLFKSWGFKLVNGTSGGEGSDGFKGKKHSEKTKELIKINSRKIKPLMT